MKSEIRQILRLNVLASRYGVVRRVAVGGLFSLAVCAATPVQGQAGDAVRGLAYDAATDQLKVAVESESLRRVLEDISVQTGIEIFLETDAEGELTAQFEFMPLDDALTELLRDKDYVAVRTADGSRIARLWVRSNRTGKPNMRGTLKSRRADTMHPITETTAPEQVAAVPRADLAPPTPAELDALVDLTRQLEDEFDEDIRSRLEQMLAQLDPEFDPWRDGPKLSDRELIDLVLTSVLEQADALTPLQPVLPRE